MSARYAQIVMGPAGSGKSTYIKRMMEYFETTKRNVHAINLDPAADDISYNCSVDIREAISVKEVMKSLNYGPNGALIYCMEQIAEDYEWFDDAIGEHDYDYLLFDTPGQIELFSHLSILPKLFGFLKQKGYNLVAVFLLDSQFMIDPSKFFSGCLVSVSAMTMFEIPHINLMSKCDLLTEEQKENLDAFLDMDTQALSASIQGPPGLTQLTHQICKLLEEFNLIEWLPFDITDNDGLYSLTAQIDLVLQYYDNADYLDDEFNGDEPNSESDSEK